MSSRIRPYLNIKQSILSLFRTTARWLKDTTAQESIFEKPYLDQDYRAMHLNLPNPDWPRTPDFEGFFPDKRGTWTFEFDPGICSLGVLSLGCGEEGDLSVNIGLLPPSSLKTQTLGIAWEAISSDPSIVEVTGVDEGISGAIHLKALEAKDGTATICVKGTLKGQAIKELVVPFERKGVLDYREAAALPALNREYYEGYVYDCGCTDINVECICTEAVWDYDTSAETITPPASGDPDTSVVIAVIDSTDSLKTWTVSGVGFWLNAGNSITTLTTKANSVTLYADSTACGTATITACGATGYVRSTEGQWSAYDTKCGSQFPGGTICYGTRDKYNCQGRCACGPTSSCQTCEAVMTSYVGACEPLAGFCSYPGCGFSCSCSEPPCAYGIFHVQCQEWECV